MRRMVLIFMGLLAAVFAVGTLMDRDGEYTRERNLWQIQRDFQEIALHPESTPASASEKIIGKLNRFIEKNPASKLAPKANIMIGDVHVFEQKFDEGRAIFQKTAEDYRYNTEVVTEALSASGRSYEKQGNWPQAKAIYDGIIKDYPLTNTGFMLPMYLVQYYASRGSVEQGDQAFGEAKAFYVNIAGRYPGTPLGQSALRMAKQSETARKRWEESLLAAEGVRVKRVYE